MINWYELALDPTIRRLGDVIREQFGVWVGFLDREGRQVGIGTATGPQPRLLCERLMVNDFEGPGSASNSCRGSLVHWSQRDQVSDAPDPFKSCHVGLGAVTLPLHVRGEVAGSVYASGFLTAERAEQTLQKLREELTTREIVRAPELDSLAGSVPILDRAQRGCLHAMLRSIAGLTTDLVEGAADTGDATDLDRYGDMIGASREMRRLFTTLGKVSRGDSTVLIQGENGTGKELIARAIHQKSRRVDHPFIVQNCAAIPTHLIESELFGHKKGAFSGAHRDRVGLFETANHGTFFLDEIGEMDLSLQVKLLRALQEGTFLPVGDNVYRKVDVRVICATNRDLREMVGRGEFREDLFYRINVITVEAPPLRHRRDDVPVLASHFLSKSCVRHDRARKVLSEGALAALARHSWPGNVRELENEIERAVIMSGDAKTLEADDFSVSSREDDASHPLMELTHGGLEMPDAVERLERQMILEGLRRTGWNKTQTAKELGVSRRNLIRKVAAYDLERHRD